MKAIILHESRGRLRIGISQRCLTLAAADKLEYYLQSLPGVVTARVNDRTRTATICFIGQMRRDIVQAIARFSFTRTKVDMPEHTGRELTHTYQDKLFYLVIRRAINKFILPFPLRTIFTLFRSAGYIWRGLSVLGQRKLEVPVLDAATIAVSILRRDFSTAGAIMFLLRFGEIMEEWTHKKSVEDLASNMYLQVEKVWICSEGGSEKLINVADVQVGEQIVVRSGNVIPLDGLVIGGEASVNQSSMTGESLAVRKATGSYVYAGTVVEEGVCTIRVTERSGFSRYDQIAQMIEESEKLKSASETKAAHLADTLVPYSLGATILAWLLTQNTVKALSILMVDFSCALKLATPISVLSAMRECSEYNISVKGGKFLEAVSAAKTIVFDKTGTLTYAEPRVAKIVTFGGHEENDMLVLAACLEEHYPHSIANAVVEEAHKRDLCHEERHSEVEYVVAHGISSRIDGLRALIGSYHFIFQDKGIRVPKGEIHKFNKLPEEYSHLFLALGDELAAVICIEDKIREEASAVIRGLRRAGFDKVVMMTGDSEKTARAVAGVVGVDEVYAEVLPGDKANFIKREHEAGRKVVMIGDGINDSPALSEADAGVAINTGAAIAREVADITIAGENLAGLITLKRLSNNLMERIDYNYKTIISFNLGLIGLGFFGILSPTTTALFHNISTLLISLHDMKDLLDHTDREINIPT